MTVIEHVDGTRPWLSHYPQHVPHELDYPEVPVHRFLTESARVWPDRTALMFFGRRTSYAALLDEVQRLAAGLVRLGLNKGDRVGIMLPNCPQLVAAYYAVLWAGGIVVMISPIYSARELVAQLRDSQARFLIALDLLAARVAQALDDAPIERVLITGLQERMPFPTNLLYRISRRRQGQRVKVSYGQQWIRYSSLLSEAPQEEPVPVDPRQDLALLQYTGGTTGTPKGVMLTPFNLVANCVQIHSWLPPQPDDQHTILGVLPCFHVYGMTAIMNFGIMTGACMVLLPRFEVGRALRAIQERRATLFPGVPTMYVALNNHPDLKRLDLTSLQWCISGAAPLPQAVKDTFEQRTGGRLVEGYGLTEASAATHINPLEEAQEVGSIGLPLPDTDCRIVDPDTGEPLAVGQAGELVVRGPQVMLGYWDRPEETADTVKDGWLHTGDIARMDDRGYFYIVDRKKEMIIASGYNVYPREVEEVLYQHPAVKEAAVIGVAHSYRGETVKAFVVLEEGEHCSGEDLAQWCRERLAPYKVPREVEFAPELPKSMVGKVLRRVLAEQERSRRAQSPQEGASEARPSGAQSGTIEGG